jgi:hypothetical protein
MLTLLSVVLAFALLVAPEFYPVHLNLFFLATLMSLGGTATLLFVPFLHMWILDPMQRLENNLIPRLLSLLRKDFFFSFIHFLLLLFSLFSYFLAIILISIDFPYPLILVACWIIALGITLDLIKMQWKRAANFLNPFYMVDTLTKEARKSIRDEKDDHLWSCLDALSEISLRSIEKSQIALGNQTITVLPPLVHAFFDSYKSISRVNTEQSAPSGRDEASYTIFYLLQRLDLINNRALRHGLQTICSQMILALGKIIVSSAQFDLSMMTFPVRYLGKFAVQAQRQNMNEIGDLATSTLIETSKTILQEVNLTYTELVEPFDAVINALDNIAKEIFRKDKTSSISLLIQPLKDLRTLFEAEKLAQHPDTPTIIQSINRVLIEFDALEQVMRTLPPIISDQS